MFKLVVLISVLALAAAKPDFITPFGYAPLGTPIAYSTPILSPYNYRGPLSLAPGQPANIIAADGRPLDTLEVNNDRAAHFTAKALDGSGIHLLKKRSVASLAYSSPIIAASPIAYSTPFAYSAPLLTPSNYRGPLSLAPGQPANILGADGRPLDTLEVNADRAAHYATKAFDGSSVHFLKKRSVAAFGYSSPIFHAAPLAYSAPFAYSATIAYSAPIITPSNYRGPLSLAPGQPANILAADGRPLDTLEVNADRAAHYTAKVLSGSGVHLLKKRSVAAFGYSAPFAVSHASTIAYSAPLAHSVPLPLQAPFSHLSYAAPISHVW